MGGNGLLILIEAKFGLSHSVHVCPPHQKKVLSGVQAGQD